MNSHLIKYDLENILLIDFLNFQYQKNEQCQLYTYVITEWLKEKFYKVV